MNSIKKSKNENERRVRKKVFRETLVQAQPSENQLWNRFKHFREVKINRSKFVRILKLRR